MCQNWFTTRKVQGFMDWLQSCGAFFSWLWSHGTGCGAMALAAEVRRAHLGAIFAYAAGNRRLSENQWNSL